jgi:DNA-binding CsgD family transcriptional regulator
MKEKILELRQKGYTVNQIVNELGCAKSTVSYHINNHNLGGSVNGFLFGISQETIDTIKKLRLENKTYSEILSLIDISEDKLVKICKILKLNFNIKNLIAKNLNKDEVKKLYLEIKSKKKVAKILGVSHDTITKLLNGFLIVKNKRTKTEAVISWRKRKKAELVEYKGGKCEKCGYDKCVQALQFHHLNPKEKDFAVGGKSYSFERLKKEVDKCIMVCANCHIEIHEEIRKK